MSFIWNPDAKRTGELEDQTIVRATSYMEVNTLLGTSGCSKDQNLWSWEVLGIIETQRGRLVVCPGDLVTELPDGVYIVTGAGKSENGLTLDKTGVIIIDAVGIGHPDSVYDLYPINRQYKKPGGLPYTLLAIANKRPTKPGFVPTVLYIGADGLQWTLPFSEWVAKFTLIDEII